MELTEKLRLKKPGLTDYVNIGDLNENMDILDEEVGNLKEVAAEIDEVEKKITKIENDIDERWGETSKNIDGMDLNNLLESGIYSGNKLINSPLPNYYCYIEVIQLKTSSVQVYQRLRGWGSSGRTYERNRVNGTWQEWKQVANEDDIKKTTDRITDIESDISERWGTIVKNIDGADLDEVIQSGVYSGNKLINGPSGDTGPFYIEVFRRSSSAVYQRVIYWTGSNVIGLSERFLVNGTWRDWKSIAYKDDIKKAMDRADAAFQSASDGKKVVATAITGKGVPTNPTDTFQKMATNIGAIETDKTGDATALGGDILEGKTAYGKGKKLIGTMPKRGMIGKVISTEGGQVKLEEGYYQYVTITARFPNLIPGNVRKGFNVGGVIGSYNNLPEKPFDWGAIRNDQEKTIDFYSGGMLFITTGVTTHPYNEGEFILVIFDGVDTAKVIEKGNSDRGDFTILKLSKYSITFKMARNYGDGDAWGMYYALEN